jgi:hypothetical protein
MPHDRKSVDALLATASSRLLRAAAGINLMREGMRQGRPDMICRGAMEMQQHISVAHFALDQASPHVAAEQFVIPEKGGLPN